MAKDYSKEQLQEIGMLDVSKYSKQDKEFYSSKEWIDTSQKYKETNPHCEPCLKEDRKSSTEIVHHILPISQDGEPFNEDNLISVCKKCHSYIHTGIGIRIDSDFIKDLLEREITEEDIWWSEIESQYADRQNEISALIRKAISLEKSDINKSIETYYRAYNRIDEFDEILNNDPMVEKAYCLEFGISNYRNVRYPVNRLSLLLEKAKKYDECIKLIEDYEKKNDKVGLTITDAKVVEKRKLRITNKLEF